VAVVVMENGALEIENDVPIGGPGPGKFAYK
jgi:hypothetical protein